MTDEPVGVECDVDGCDERVVGIDDGWEFERGTVCRTCIEFNQRHGHWPDEDREFCRECVRDGGGTVHDCDDSEVDVVLRPGDSCPNCGFELAATDGGQSIAERIRQAIGDQPGIDLADLAREANLTSREVQAAIRDAEDLVLDAQAGMVARVETDGGKTVQPDDRPDPTYVWSDSVKWTYEASADPRAFNQALEPANAIADECLLTLTPERLQYGVVDPAMVAMVAVDRPCMTGADGTVDVGVPVVELCDELPAYYRGSSTYDLRVFHDPSDEGEHRCIVESGVDHGCETAAFDPDSIRDMADWPTPDEGYDIEVSVPTHKLRGAITALADTTDYYIAVAPVNGQLTLASVDEDNEQIESWSLDVPVSGRVEQWYSADYVGPMLEAWWHTGETVLQFGEGQPLHLQTDGLRYAQAPRVMDDKQEVFHHG